MCQLLLFLRNDLRAFLNLCSDTGNQSFFKAIVIGIFAAGLLAGLFLIFLDAFRFLTTLGGIGVMIIQHLFSFFFFGLGAMLVISNVITAYSLYFRSADVAFLMVRPLRHGIIALHKFIESAVLSSWAFFVIMIPFMAAFAWHQKLPLVFALWTIVFSIPFVGLCSAVGVIVALLAVRFLPRLKARLWFALAGAAIVAYHFLGPNGLKDVARDDASFLMTGLVPGIRFTSFQLWPSWWVAEGIMALVRERWDRGALFFCVLFSNLLMAALLVEWIGEKLYYRAWQNAIAVVWRRGIKPAARFSLGEMLARLLPSECRAVVMKDIRTFMRDPVQLIQGLLFFGLLAIYFFNLRSLHYNLVTAVWRNLISFLNVFSLATIMCSFCSRFIFPQISLEGHAFWLIGLSPTGMARVLKYKFALAVVTMVVVSGTLLTVSAVMLDVNRYVLVVNIIMAVALSFGLCGLSLGLGAVFINLKQTNPVAIISGFGGTFNLVLSLAYIILAILPFGVISHAHLAGRMSHDSYLFWVFAACLWLAVLTAATAVLPLVAGKRALVAREY